MAKCWLGRLIGSCDVVRNPSLKSERNVRRRCSPGQAVLIRWRTVRSLTRTVRPQPHSGPRAVCLQPLGSRRLETRYIGWVAIRQRVAVGRCGSLV